MLPGPDFGVGHDALVVAKRINHWSAVLAALHSAAHLSRKEKKEEKNPDQTLKECVNDGSMHAIYEYYAAKIKGTHTTPTYERRIVRMLSP